MFFINTPLNVNELPAAEQVELKPVQRKYLSLLRVEWIITAIILIAIAVSLLIFADLSYNWSIIIPGATAVLLVFYFIQQEQSFKFLAYAVREKDVIIQKGWIIRTTKICPYNRIQNCTLNTGPLERKYGLASLSLYTAGSTGADMRLNGLTLDEAESLRQFILNKINSEDAAAD